MKHLLIIGGFPPPITGQKLSNQTVYREMNARGYSTDALNITTSFNKSLLGNLILSMSSVLIYLLAIKKIAVSDVVYMTISQSSTGFIRFVPFVLLCRLLRKPYFLHLKGNLLPKTIERSNPLFRRLIYSVLNKAQAVIFLSEKLRDQEVFTNLKSTKSVLYNFVEEQIYVSKAYAAKNLKIRRRLDILYLSNLIESKGILYLLEAIVKLKSIRSDFKLFIAGFIDQEIESQTRDYLVKIGKEFVDYRGVVDGEEKYRLLMESHVFVLPTYYPQEGQPISLLEAMASGTVPITTNHSGISDIVINGRNGFFVRKRNSEDITTLLESMLDGEIDLIAIARQNVEEAERYRVATFIDNLEQIFKGTEKPI